MNGPFLSGKEVDVLFLRSLLILDEKLLFGHLLVSLLLHLLIFLRIDELVLLLLLLL